MKWIWILIKAYLWITEEAKVAVTFVDGTVTNDSSQLKACKNDADIERFGQYVTFDTPEVVIPANDSIQTSFSLEFPGGVSWKVYGCIISKLIQEKTETLKHVIVKDIKVPEIEKWHLLKRQAPNNTDDPSNNSLKVLDMRSISPRKRRNGNLVIRHQHIPTKHEMYDRTFNSFKLWNFGTKKPGHFETKKHWNQETK